MRNQSLLFNTMAQPETIQTRPCPRAYLFQEPSEALPGKIQWERSRVFGGGDSVLVRRLLQVKERGRAVVAYIFDPRNWEAGAGRT